MESREPPLLTPEQKEIRAEVDRICDASMLAVHALMRMEAERVAEPED